MILTTTIEGLDQARGSYADLERRCDDLSRPLKRLGLHHQRKAQRILRSGSRGVQSRNPSSGLEGSTTFRLPATNALEVGSNKAYARVQQRGGTVESSRPGGFLAIPAGENVGARGNPKYTSPREVEDGFFFRSKRGGLFFGRRREKGKRRSRRKRKGENRFAEAMLEAAGRQLELLFVLVKQVTIPAHWFATHEPEDQRIWDGYAADWLLRGK